MRFYIVTYLLFVELFTYGQLYNVQVEDRNKTVELTNQAVNKIAENRLDEAIADLNEALKIDSTFRPTYQNLYKALMQKKDYTTTTIDLLSKAKRIFQEDDEICYYLGEVYRMNNELKKAVEEYSSAINFSKKNGEDFELVHLYYFNRGNCYLKMNMIDPALNDYSYALKLKPDYSYALLNRGICFIKKGNPADACNDWTKAFEQGNNNAKVYLDKYCKQN